MTLREKIRSLDWIIASAALLLVLISLAMIFSSRDTGASLLSGLLARQLFSFVVAVCAGAAVSLFPYHVMRQYAPLLYAGALTTLVLVAVAAPAIRGAASRFEFFGIQIQPSEFMKVALIIVLAWILARHKRPGISTYILSAGAVALPATLVAFEPDIGEVALMLGLWGTLVFFSGISWRAVILLVLAGIASFAAAWSWLFVDYQKQRILTFFNPNSDPLGAGYNITQAIVALGSGGILGRGLGHGPQSQLRFLPERHTDFILASIGEELGLVGILIIITLYVVILWRIMRIVTTTQDLFGQYLAAGVFILLLLSFFISSGMNMGLLPVTGIPLPLVSYGGSSLLSTFILLGLVESIHVYGHWVRTPPLEFDQFT